MASWPSRINQQQQRIPITIYANIADVLDVARRAAFMPQFLAAAAPKVGFARFLGSFEGFLVHPGNHENVAGGVVLDYGRYQPPLIKS